MPASLKNKTNFIWLLLLLFTVAAFCAVHFWVFLKVPMGVDWKEKEEKLYGDGCCSLKNKTVVVRLGDGVTGSKRDIAWNTPKAWLVQDFLLTDLDGDDDIELILLVWKRGRYGSARPFWVKSDEKSYSQHIFIFDVDEKLEVRQKWLASDIGPVVRRFKLMERNPSIILTEEESGHCSLWRWESWGLKSMDNEVSMVAFGDNLIHDSILEYGLKTEGGDFSFLYEPFREEIENADIAALNLETPLVDKVSAYGGYPSFGTPIAVGEAIAEAGFDIAACANNHCLDRGLYGIDVTTSFCRDNGITCLGITSPYDSVIEDCKTVSRNGITFALFNYTYGVNGDDENEKLTSIVNYLPEDETGEKELVKTLKSARDYADIVIVFVHWGEEYDTTVSESQKHFAQVFADGDADVVIGCHPHVVQETQEIDRQDGGKTIVYYSLGNFRADQGKEEATRIGGEAVINFEHCYEGVRISGYDFKKINAYWK